MIQQTVAAVQHRVHSQIAAVVTRALEEVFDDNYEFKIAFECKRGRTEARLLFARGGHDFDPVASTGGGVVDVASLALRVACLVLERPRKLPLLVLDEPLKHLSSAHRPRARRMMETCSKELGLQILFVTHSRELVAGLVVELG